LTKLLRISRGCSVWRSRTFDLSKAEVDVTIPGATAFLLTPRERQILELLLRGLSAREISRSEELRPQTVKNYVTTIYQKLGVADRAELIEEWGHLTEGSPAL